MTAQEITQIMAQAELLFSSMKEWKGEKENPNRRQLRAMLPALPHKEVSLALDNLACDGAEKRDTFVATNPAYVFSAIRAVARTHRSEKRWKPPPEPTPLTLPWEHGQVLRYTREPDRVSGPCAEGAVHYAWVYRVGEALPYGIIQCMRVYFWRSPRECHWLGGPVMTQKELAGYTAVEPAKAAQKIAQWIALEEAGDLTPEPTMPRGEA